MLSIEPNKHCFGFNLKKFVLEAAYAEATLSERNCRQWINRFMNNEFNVEDKKRRGRPKLYEDANFAEVMKKDSCQMQKILLWIVSQ